MKKNSKQSSSRKGDDLYIPPITRESLRKGVMGKYYAQVMTSSNVVRIAPDVNVAFPNEAAVNQALRELLKMKERLQQITSEKPRRRSA